MARLRDTEEFGPTLDAVAERLDISATAVEKDYWVSEVLRVLAAASPDDFIFKGGTSLSKAYRIAERFSEDIDVLVLPGQRGRGAVDKLMKAMGEVAAAGVGGAAVCSPVVGSRTMLAVPSRLWQVATIALRDAAVTSSPSSAIRRVRHRTPSSPRASMSVTLTSRGSGSESTATTAPEPRPSARSPALGIANRHPQETRGRPRRGSSAQGAIG